MIALGIEKACFASSAGALCRQQGAERTCADCNSHMYLLYPQSSPGCVSLQEGSGWSS